jgi:hypothetical protein
MLRVVQRAQEEVMRVARYVSYFTSRRGGILFQCCIDAMMQPRATTMNTITILRSPRVTTIRFAPAGSAANARALGSGNSRPFTGAMETAKMGLVFIVAVLLTAGLFHVAARGLAGERIFRGLACLILSATLAGMFSVFRR